MRDLRSLITAVATAVLLFPLSACLSRTRAVQSTIPSTVLDATLPQLIASVNQEAMAIKTVKADVEIATSVGGQRKGKVTDYESIPGYILIKQPGMIRMIGLVPVVRTTLFDMVSDGSAFKLSIPAKNKFFEGTNEVTHPSQNSLENIRPDVIENALLIPPIDPEKEIAVRRIGTEKVEDLHDKKNKKQIELPTYTVATIRKGPDGWYLSRRIIFNRVDLKPQLQEIFDRDGNVMTQATYQDYETINGVSFPHTIKIVRPKEEYEINLEITKLQINAPLTDQQFQLKQPQGAQLQVLK